jgi:hypothetical protein
VQAMFGHSDCDRRQLGHLTPRRPGDIDALGFGENVRARPTAVGPMLDDVVDLLGRKQPPVPALVPLLPAPLAAGPLPPRAWRSRRGILRRRQRRVPGTPIQATLELGNPSLEPRVRVDQTLVRLNQLVQPLQQTNSRLPIAIDDRLSFRPLHPGEVRRAKAGPFLLETHKTLYLRRSPSDPSEEDLNAYCFCCLVGHGKLDFIPLFIPISKNGPFQSRDFRLYAVADLKT